MNHFLSRKEIYTTCILLISFWLTEIVANEIEYYFLSIQHPEVIDSYVFSIRQFAITLSYQLIHTLLNFGLFISLMVLLKRQWYTIPIAVAAVCAINCLLSLMNVSHPYFSLSANNIISFVFYETALYTVLFLTFGKSLNIYVSIALFYGIYFMHRIGNYIGLDVLSSDTDIPFRDMEFLRYIVYSCFFALIYFLFTRSMKVRIEGSSQPIKTSNQ
ncbi:hypothetical protein DMA11_18895 [Marinilabiliaceae bacterium JC017]|nr:hypothetical protein DMA11_18895 [Marinilabiliaceae bacterium JC017]